MILGEHLQQTVVLGHTTTVFTYRCVKEPGTLIVVDISVRTEAVDLKDHDGCFLCGHDPCKCDGKGLNTP